MQVAFVDESSTRAGVFLFGSVIATAPQILDLTRALDQITAGLAVTHGLDPSVELHAHELFAGKGAWSGVPPRARIGAQVAIIEAIGESGALLCYRGVDGPNLRSRQARNRYPVNFTVEQEAFKHLLQRVQEIAQAKNTNILVIADERSDRDSHRRDLAMHRVYGTPGDYWRTTLDRILDTVHFAPSHHSRMLQAVDHYVFFTRRRLEVQKESDARAESAMERIMAIISGNQSQFCGVWTP